jgi:hypothetical protein
MTADFIGAEALSLSGHFNPVILDHGIGEQFFGRVLKRSLRAGAVGALDFDVEDLALAHASDARDAKRPQRAFDRLALWVQNAGFHRDDDAGFHTHSISMNRDSRNYAGNDSPHPWLEQGELDLKNPSKDLSKKSPRNMPRNLERDQIW